MKVVMAVELNESIYISLVCCFIFALIAMKLTRRIRSKSINNLPPSPPKLPIIGNLHQIGKLTHRSFRDLSHKYGPLMLLHLGQTPTLVVSSADLAREMAKSHDVVFSDRPSTTAAKTLFYECNDLIFAPYGESWKQKRRITVAEFLAFSKVRSFHFIIEEEVADLVNEIREACMKKNSDDGSSSSSSSVSVNLFEMILVTSANIMCRCVLGHKYEIGEIVLDMMHQMGKFSFGDSFPSLWWMDVVTGLLPRMKATSRKLQDFIDCKIEKHRRKKMNAHENNNLLDILVQLHHHPMPDFDLSLVSVKAIVANLFAAGVDSSAITMEWAMAELMKHQEKMKKAQEEVRGIVGDKTRIEESDVNQTRYLKCVLKETLRLHPPSPLLAPRKTKSRVKLGGYDIPSETNVLVNGWAIHRDPKHWERPEEFVPERFENSNVDFTGQNFQFKPFGFGRRVCPGLSFGVASIEYTLCNLLYWFDWKLPSGEEDLDMSEASGQVVSKKIPLLLQPIPRYF